ncbi:MAG TPA: hypothetical protein VFA50_10630 [Stellaceae bacterium]|nr:hypothetical protein [Stellaceae bacterium]
MKQPEEMTLNELRTELRQMGVTDRLTALVRREMQAAEQRVAKASGKAGSGKAKYDPLRAQLFVLKANGMTNPDLTLNRKGMLFVTLTTREEIERAA